MSTTRIFGNNPFEVFLKPTNKIEVKISGTSVFKQGSIVAYDGLGTLTLANASDRSKSSVLGVVTDLSNGVLTIVTQGLITVTPQGVSDSPTKGDIYFLHENQQGTLKLSPPSALGTTRIPVIQVIDGGYLVLGVPGIVNGISYRGYVNIAAIQPVGTVSPFVGNTTLVPKNWLFCDGSYVSIDTYADLYRMIGSIYGEVQDGRFKLPDFRGRTLIGAGSGSSLSSRFIGEFGGEEKHTMSITEMPSHSHKPSVGTDSGVDHWWGSDDRVGTPNFDYDGTSGTKPTDGFLAPSYKTDNVGGNSPHNNMPPYSVANWIIRAKAESEFALLDVNVESLTNVDKEDVPSNGDVIKYDGSTWRFVANTVANANDVTFVGVQLNDLLIVNSIDATTGVPTFKTSPPTGSNINVNTTTRSHKNGSPRPSSVVIDLGNSTDAPVGRKGLVHIHGTIEIEPTAGTTDGTVNINLTGYGGTTGLDITDTVIQAHYSQGSKKILLPFHATVMAQIYQTSISGELRSAYKFSYYLSTETGSQFKANKLTINNVKFVY